MPKATLEFNLPEEDLEHLNALRGTSYKIALDEMDNYIRNRLKYEDISKEARKTLEEVRVVLGDFLMEAEQ